MYDNIKKLLNNGEYLKAKEFIQKELNNHPSDELYYLYFLSDNGNYIDFDYLNINNTYAFNKACEGENKDLYNKELKIYSTLNKVESFNKIFRFMQIGNYEKALSLLKEVKEDKIDIFLDDEFILDLEMIILEDKNNKDKMSYYSKFLEILYLKTTNEKIINLHFEMEIIRTSSWNKSFMEVKESLDNILKPNFISYTKYIDDMNKLNEEKMNLVQDKNAFNFEFEKIKKENMNLRKDAETINNYFNEKLVEKDNKIETLNNRIYSLEKELKSSALNSEDDYIVYLENKNNEIAIKLQQINEEYNSNLESQEIYQRAVLLGNKADKDPDLYDNAIHLLESIKEYGNSKELISFYQKKKKENTQYVQREEQRIYKEEKRNKLRDRAANALPIIVNIFNGLFIFVLLLMRYNQHSLASSSYVLSYYNYMSFALPFVFVITFLLMIFIRKESINRGKIGNLLFYLIIFNILINEIGFDRDKLAFYSNYVSISVFSYFIPLILMFLLSCIKKKQFDFGYFIVFFIAVYELCLVQASLEASYILYALVAILGLISAYVASKNSSWDFLYYIQAELSCILFCNILLSLSNRSLFDFSYYNIHYYIMNGIIGLTICLIMKISDNHYKDTCLFASSIYYIYILLTLVSTCFVSFNVLNHKVKDLEYFDNYIGFVYLITFILVMILLEMIKLDYKKAYKIYMNILCVPLAVLVLSFVIKTYGAIFKTCYIEAFTSDLIMKSSLFENFGNFFMQVLFTGGFVSTLVFSRKVID